MMDLNEALRVASGLVRVSTVERRAAWQMLHSTGAAYRLGGKFAETCRNMIADGVIKEEVAQ